MRTLVFGLFALSLSACAPHMSGATPAGGIVTNYSGASQQALQIAQAHCQQYGKNAVVTSQNVWDDNMTFECK
jgi:hypothetical protein